MSIPSVYAENGPQGETAEQIASKCQLNYNVKDSLLMSIATLCLPGILENVQQLRSIEARKIKCTYNAIVNDLDPAYCKKVASYENCKFVVGEIFELPIINMVEQLRETVARALANPIGIIWSEGVQAARKYVEGACVSSVSIECNAGENSKFIAPSVLIIVTDGLALADMYDNMRENGFKEFFWNEAENEVTSGSPDIYEIKEEMELIIKQLEINTADAQD